MTQTAYHHLQSRIEQGVLVLTVTAPTIQDEGLAEALREELLAAVAGAAQVVIDFQHTKYLSSVAFRPLLSLRQRLRETGGRLILCGLSAAIGDVFYTTRLVDESGSFSAPFQLEPDVAAAVARLNRPEEQGQKPT
jgi:anti-anti-sigma factor